MEPASFDCESHLCRLQTQGYTVIADFLSPAALDAVRDELRPFLGRYRGRNDFEGHRTERVYTLVARAPVFERLAEDARILALCDRLLQPGYLLTASQAICIHPGETPQPVHSDDSFYPLPRPRPAISLSTIVAVDAFTAANGATEVIPGSHTWGDDRLTGTYRAAEPALETDAPGELQNKLEPVTMPAGACLVFPGTLLHRGGANRSDAPRLAFSNQYCEPWARTQENFFLGIPPLRAAQMSARLQQLLGYSIWGPFMGHVTASHPRKVLQPGHVNAVLAGRSSDAMDPP